MKKIYLSSGSLFGLLGLFLLAICLLAGASLVVFSENLWWFPGALIFGIFLSMVFFEPPPEMVFWLAKKAGYNGVELILTNHVVRMIQEQPDYFPRLAKNYQLGLTYHQPWDILDVFQKVTVWLMIMPPLKRWQEKINSVLACGISPVVIHSNHINKIPLQFLPQCRVEIVSKIPVPSSVEGLVFDCFYSLGQNLPLIRRRDGTIIIDPLWLWVNWTEIIERPSLKGRWKEFHFYDFKFIKKNKVNKNLLPAGPMVQKLMSFVSDEEVVVFEISPLEFLRRPKFFYLLPKKFGDK